MQSGLLISAHVLAMPSAEGRTEIWLERTRMWLFEERAGARRSACGPRRARGYSCVEPAELSELGLARPALSTCEPPVIRPAGTQKCTLRHRRHQLVGVINVRGEARGNGGYRRATDNGKTSPGAPRDTRATRASPMRRRERRQRRLANLIRANRGGRQRRPAPVAAEALCRGSRQPTRKRSIAICSNIRPSGFDEVMPNDSYWFIRRPPRSPDLTK